MLADDAVHHREPQPGTLPRLLGGKERFKDAGLRRGIHADPGVDHADHRVGTGRQRGGPVGRGRADLDVIGLEAQGPALRHRVPCVHGEVQEHLLELSRIRVDLPRARPQGEQQGDVLADQAPEHGARLPYRAVEIEVPALEHLLPAEGQELPGETGGAIRRLLDLLDAAPKRIVGLQPSQQQHAAPGDDGQQVVEV
ncbi:MAG TPA: hypothetical protein VJ794_02160, partial [Gemmatimonadales bacterium]|nr:hypothetical protein [Gemmatimonadales bacterium]